MTDPRDIALAEALRTIDRQQAVIDGLRHQRNELEAEVAWLRSELRQAESRSSEAQAVVNMLPPAGSVGWRPIREMGAP